MAANKKAEAFAQLDAICDEFERAVSTRRRKGSKPVNLDVWLRRVDPSLRPWLRRELSAIDRELNAIAPSIKRRPDDTPVGVDPAVWRAIKRNQTFRKLSLDARESLSRGIRPASFPAGATLLQSGQRASGLYLLRDGEVEIVVVDGDNRTTIDIDGRGSLLGEISTITGEPCTADVIAIESVNAWVLPADEFDVIRTKHPEIEIALSQLVSDRLGQQARDALCGKSLGGYRLDRCLSTGAMGVVYRATQESDGLPCALKMLRHRFIYSPLVISRFEQEVDLLRELNHPNIVSMRGHFVAYRTRFIVLDLYDGTDLRKFLRDHGPMDEPSARGVLGQIADGLRHAHRRGVLHLDLKPANILIDRSGHVAITDFGLGRLIESDGCDLEAVGTPLYMPPEQFTMRNVGTHSDWYALGCLAYELLTAEPLYPRGNELDLFEYKEREPDDRWPCVEADEEYRKFVCAAIQPSAEQRNIDVDQIASWARDVPELMARADRRLR